MDMVDSMLEYDKSIKTQYEAEKAELEAAKSSLEDSKAQQAEVLTQLEIDKASYEALSSEQEAYIQSLESDLSRANSALEEAKAADNALNNELQQYLAELAEQDRLLAEQRAKEEAERAAREAASQTADDGGAPDSEPAAEPTPVYSDTGGFIWPLVGYTYVTSGFGWRMLNGVADNHLGIDIGAPSGVPIYASKSGTVEIATFHHSYGNYVLINHGLNSNGDLEATLYAHMSAIACSPGQYVNQGDIIGYVGCTGYAFGAHLHFEVRIDGTPNNPLNFVSP